MRYLFLELTILASQCLAGTIPGIRSTVTTSAEPIAERYIVQLKPSVDAKQHLAWVQDIHARSVEKRALSNRSPLEGIGKDLKIGDSFRAYTGQFDDETVESIRANKDVLLVEQDQTIHLNQLRTRSDTVEVAPRAVQTGVGYNLRFISQRPPAKRDAYFYNNTASFQWAYVVDTGINIQHVEFEGRASNGYNAVSGSQFQDTNGHGTAVAGIIGARTYGVAKKVNLVAVKVIASNSASTSVILDGISWAVNDITNKGRTGSAVLNLSIGGAYSQAMNNAVKAAYNSGILSAVGAGSEAGDVQNSSPASAPEAITVGACDSSYRVASFSNYGSGLDLYAPGVSIMVPWIGSTTATNTLSGTAMAAPHVAGIVAMFQESKGKQKPSVIRDYIVAVASKNALTGVPSGTANLLAYNDSGM